MGSTAPVQHFQIVSQLNILQKLPQQQILLIFSFKVRLKLTVRTVLQFVHYFPFVFVIPCVIFTTINRFYFPIHFIGNPELIW